MFKVSLKTELEKSKVAITMQKSEATTVSGNIFKSRPFPLKLFKGCLP